MKSFRVALFLLVFTLIFIMISVFFSLIILNKNASGSLIKQNKTVVGSLLIGQDFNEKEHFHGRISKYNYKSNISGNSENAYYSKLNIEKTVESYKTITNLNTSTPDLNLVTESCSGLDPHITEVGALSQVKRISRHSNLSEDALIKLISENSKPRIFGILGEKIVNVLILNLKLEQLYGKPLRSK